MRFASQCAGAPHMSRALLEQPKLGLAFNHALDHLGIEEHVAQEVDAFAIAPIRPPVHPGVQNIMNPLLPSAM